MTYIKELHILLKNINKYGFTHGNHEYLIQDLTDFGFALYQG